MIDLFVSIELYTLLETQFEEREISDNGPATAAAPFNPPKIPKAVACNCKDILAAMSKMVPERSPAAPIPVIARPSIKPTEVGVAADTTDPISKITRFIM